MDESTQARELENMYVILPPIDVSGYEEVNYSHADLVDGEYTSAGAEHLSKNEIINFVESIQTVPEA
jgi:hypothetical protein